MQLALVPELKYASLSYAESEAEPFSDIKVRFRDIIIEIFNRISLFDVLFDMSGHKISLLEDMSDHNFDFMAGPNFICEETCD